MNGMNNSNEDVVECPLCMEPLEVDDLNFYPCTCGYQICRFCWHRIRTDENELCPACRKAYPENPADFTPLSQEQISALKTEKRQRDQQRKQKITENRKHLANVRVVQKNLVFVVGLPPRLADADILKKHEYFGKYGKIHKVVINPSTTYAGVQGPSASAYVTYCINNDALRAIQSVNNIMIDGRLIKTSLGTTKYCSHFMKNQQCPKPDCMYLHELGDPEASFTKEEMHQGKHQEYEKRLHDALITQTAAANNAPGKLEENKFSSQTQNEGIGQSKEAWPCLSTSPDNKECKTNGKGTKDSTTKKTRSEKPKGKKGGNHNNSNNSRDTGFYEVKNTNPMDILNKQEITMSVDEELNLISEIENDALLADLDGKTNTPSLSSSSSGQSGTLSETASGKSSPGSFPDHPLQNVVTTNQHQIQQQNKTNLEKSSHNISNDSFGNVANSSEINTNCHPTTNGVVSNVIDTSARFSKLGLFDDNNSFFSTNTFQPYFKVDQHKNTEITQSTNTNSPQLPDLLNGTESNKDNTAYMDKLNLLKGLGEFNSQLNNSQHGYNNTTENWETFKYALSKNKHQQLETDELLGMQELQKRNNFINSLGMPHFNGLNNEYNTDYFHSNSNDPNRFSQMIQQQVQQTQHHPRIQNNIHSTDNLSHLYAGNMSKFFDFHKNQQQQQQNQQHQFLLNGHSNGPHSNDHMNLANLLESNRINSQFIDHTNNGLLGSHIHKQRLLNKYDQLGSPQQQHNHNMLHHQNNRLQNHFSQNSSVDDDLGFDPFFETQKGLAELLENEMIQQQSQNNHSKLLENCQRTRMPPPGFNHMNAFGFGVPRAQSGKVLPFMNMGSNSQSSQTHHWGQPQQQHNMGYQQTPLHEQTQNPLLQQNLQSNKTGYGSMSDWTALDPAIVSFRQFPSFMSGPSQQQQQSQHNNSAEMFMPHLNQQQMQQQMGGQGLFENKLKSIDFSNRNGMQSGYGGPHGINLQNSIINQQQQNSPAQVNFSHSNWLNTDQTQNIFMNSLSNGFSNNFEKFSIPMPPGFQNNGSKQQKAECLN